MPWLSIKDAAKALGKSERTLRRYAKTGKVESRLISGVGGRGEVYEIFIDLEKKDEKFKDTSKKLEIKDEKFKDNVKSSKKSQKTLKSDQKQESLPEVAGNKTINLKKSQIKDNQGHQGQKNEVVTKTITSRSKPFKQLLLKDFEGSPDWVPLDFVITHENVTTMTIYRKVKKKELQKVVVSCPGTRGGKKTFISVLGLKLDVQEKWREMLTQNLQSDIPEVVAKDKSKFESYSQSARDKANARREILEDYYKLKRFAKEQKQRIGQIEKNWIIKINKGEILRKAFDLLKVDSLGLNTLKKWEKLYRDNGSPIYPICLIDKRQVNSGRNSSVDGNLKSLIRAIASKGYYLKASEAYQVAKGQYEVDGNRIPITLRTFSEYVKQAREDEYLMNKLNSKKAFKDGSKRHVHRSNNADPLDVVESDGHTLNFFVYSPFYQHREVKFRDLVRPIVIMWFDVATGLILGWCITPSESPNAVRTSFVDMVEKFGVPKTLRLDNGRAYKNVNFAPMEFAKLKKDTKGKKEACKMLNNHQYGLYYDMGVEYVQFTIPRNSESKGIESFWNYAIGSFERRFPVWTGHEFNKRPEEFKLTKNALIKKFGEQIPTWEEVQQLMAEYVAEWNNKPRKILKSISGELMTPIEVYKQYPELLEYKKSRKFIDERGVLPYALEAKVYRGEIYANGIYYDHPYFDFHSGEKIRYLYDERNLAKLRIVHEDGGVWEESANAVIPGWQVGDDMEGLRQVRANQKLGDLAYIALANSKNRKASKQPLEQLLQSQEFSQDLIKDSGNNKSISTGKRLLINRNKEEIKKDIEATVQPKPKETDYTQFIDQIKVKEKEPLVKSEHEDLIKQLKEKRKSFTGEDYG